MKDATVALAALGQPTRLSIFRYLIEAGLDGRMAGEIAEALSLPGATLSFHLKELSNAGLIEGEQRGRFICYRAAFDVMNELIAFLTQDCCGGQAEVACFPALKTTRKKTAKKAVR